MLANFKFGCFLGHSHQLLTYMALYSTRRQIVERLLTAIKHLRSGRKAHAVIDIVHRMALQYCKLRLRFHRLFVFALLKLLMQCCDGIIFDFSNSRIELTRIAAGKHICNVGWFKRIR